MEIIFLNKYVRKFKRYFIISILFYLTISNDLVFGKGGGKGGKGGKSDGGSGGSDIGTSNNKVSSDNKVSSSSYSPSVSHSSRSSWVFFYYSGNGQRYCGSLCILTAVLVPTIIFLVVGCAIWKCYRIKRRNTDIEKHRIEFNDDNSQNSYNSYPYNTNNEYEANYNNNVPITNFPTPVHYPETHKNDYDFNYTPNYYHNMDSNYVHNKLSPPLSELNQVKRSSRSESLDSMEDFKKNKK